MRACAIQTDRRSSSFDDVTSAADDLGGLHEATATPAAASAAAAAVDGRWGALSAVLLVIPAAVLAGSAMTVVAIGLDRRLHQMSYYFFVSLAVQHALMSITVMLPGVHVLQSGMNVRRDLIGSGA